MSGLLSYLQNEVNTKTTDGVTQDELDAESDLFSSDFLANADTGIA